MTSSAETEPIDQLVAHFSKVEIQRLIKVYTDSFLVAIQEHPDLMENVHSIRSRIKDPDHLRHKLIRKMNSAREAGEEFSVNEENLFAKINDLTGIRLIHLHTGQFESIDMYLRKIIDEQGDEIIEGPIAKTWDPEYKKYFEDLNITTETTPSFYTSVHYVVRSRSKMPITCEIQVRTLMEEVWGEVDHTINYPDKSNSLPCREQLKVLARVTSSATRLVDAIFASQKDFSGTAD